MKKILFAAFVIFAAFFIVSCAGEDEVSNVLGGSCAIEGEEACSSDSSQILICSDSSWQMKKACNINFGEYCRVTASGSYSCKDSGSNDSTDSGNNGDDNIPEDTTDTNPDDSDTETDTEPDDDTDSDTDDTKPNDDSDSAPDNDTDTDNDNDQQEDPQDPIPAPGDCANIMNCINACEVDSEGNLVDSNCPQTCYNNGTTDGKNQYMAWENCNTSNSCEYYYDCLWTKCRDEEAVCGFAGDTANYNVPYGKVTINGTFTYLHDENEENILIANCISGGFVTGSFGRNNVSLIDSDKTPLAYATLITPTDGSDQYIVLFQGHNDETATAPIARMLVKATTAGTYTFGLGDFNEEKVRLFINEQDGSCVHAFGYGSVNISAIGYTLGETTISLSGELDIYSPKAMPYYGGDISDTNLVACEPK
ncbi:hypothetical protein J5681_08345 [bacterium]|nr:hypothetical protein [bacterium]